MCSEGELYCYIFDIYALSLDLLSNSLRRCVQGPVARLREDGLEGFAERTSVDFLEGYDAGSDAELHEQVTKTKKIKISKTKKA